MLKLLVNRDGDETYNELSKVREPCCMEFPEIQRDDRIVVVFSNAEPDTVKFDSNDIGFCIIALPEIYILDKSEILFRVANPDTNKLEHTVLLLYIIELFEI